MKKATPSIIALFALGLSQAPGQAPSPRGAGEICGNAPKTHIAITINPEVRVSAVRGSEPPPIAGPDGSVELQVQIANQGFLTAPLEARLVGSIPDGATIDFSPQPLTGASEEKRTLRIRLAAPGLADVTVSFRARNEITDLGGRDRVHFLLRRL